MDYFYKKQSLDTCICNEIVNNTIEINTIEMKKEIQYDMTIDNEMNNILLQKLCCNIEEYKKQVFFPFQELSINHYTICVFKPENRIHNFNNFGRLNHKKNILTFIWVLTNTHIKLFEKVIDIEKGMIIIIPCEWFYNIIFLNKIEIYLIIGNVYVDI